MRNIEFVRRIRIRNHQKWIEIKHQQELLEYWCNLEKELENRLYILDNKFFTEEYIEYIQSELENTKRYIGYSKTILRYLRKTSKIKTSIG